MLMSLARSRKVCIFADSLYVPVFDPLRLVEVMVILLDDLNLCGFIFVLSCGHEFLEPVLLLIKMLSSGGGGGGGERVFYFLLL